MALITRVCIQYNTVKYNLQHLTIIGKESYIRPLAKQLKINLPLKVKTEGHHLIKLILFHPINGYKCLISELKRLILCGNVES